MSLDAQYLLALVMVAEDVTMPLHMRILCFAMASVRASKLIAGEYEPDVPRA